jgi:hypothetical protein
MFVRVCWSVFIIILLFSSFFLLQGRTPFDLAAFEKKDAMADLLKDAQGK